jgi:hypothetical protein
MPSFLQTLDRAARSYEDVALEANFGRRGVMLGRLVLSSILPDSLAFFLWVAAWILLPVWPATVWEHLTGPQVAMFAAALACLGLGGVGLYRNLQRMARKTAVRL